MAENMDNEQGGSGLLSEVKNKRLEEALSSYSPEKTKQAVGRLLEEYIDEGGKNYFGAGRRDTTLYFSDDDYVKEVKKQNSERTARLKAEAEEKAKAAAEAKAKLEEAMAKAEEAEDSPEDAKEEKDLGGTTIYEPVKAEKKSKRPDTKENKMKNNDYDEDILDQEADEEEEEYIPAKSKKPEKSKKSKKKIPEPEEEPEEEFEDYDDEDYEDEYDDDYDDEDYDDDFEEVKKKKFFGFFKKNRDDDDYDDEYDDDDYDDEDYDDEYDDDDDYYDDDDYDYDDDYDEKRSAPVKKIFNIIFIVVLLCAIAVLAAMCMNYKNKYESASKQLEQNISEQNTTDQTELESLKTENEALKADLARVNAGKSSDADSEGTSKSPTGTAAMTPDQSEDDDSSTPEGKEYKVQPGDTAQKICIGVYGEYTPELWEKLKKANGKGDSDWIAGETAKP